MIQSINDNERGELKNLNINETEQIVENKKNQLFDPKNVEKEYALDLANIYDRVILFNLMDIDEKIFNNIPEGEEMQQGD